MRTILVSFLLIVPLFTKAQLIIDTTKTPAWLVENVLVGAGIDVSNVTFQGHLGNRKQIGEFSTGANPTVLGMTNGIVLATERVTRINRPASNQSDDEVGTSGYAPLTAIAGYGTKDAAVLSFDFVPLDNSISFKYLFASEEYPAYVCSDFNDIFAFFITSLDPADGFNYDNQNIALIPGTNLPVAINTINPGVHGSAGSANGCISLAYSYLYQSFQGNPYVVYDGGTVQLFANTDVAACKPYRITLAVADVRDRIFDSAVFLEANSFSSPAVGFNITYSGAQDIAIEGCSYATVTFTLASAPDVPYTINYTISGTATNGVDFPAIPSSVVIQPGTTSSSFTINPIVDGINEGTETVIFTRVNACGVETSDTVFIGDNSFITAQQHQPICIGESASLTASGANTYTWAPNTNLSATTGSSVTANPSTSTTYTVSGTDVSGCTSTATISLTVSPPPSLSASASSASLCNGESATLTASGASTYTWAPSTNLSATTGSSVTASPTSSTTYTVTGTDANGCTNTATVSLTVLPPPNFTVSASSASLCEGESATLTASGASSYTWAPNNNLSATTGSSVTASPPASATYTVTGTDANGCTNTATVSLTLLAPPNLTVSASSASLCQGESTTLTASGASTYAWAPNTNLSTTTGSSVTATPTSSTTYTVTGTDANGCTNTATVSLTISPSLTIALTAASPAICEGSSTVITATGAASYTWSPSTGLSATTGSSVTANPTTSITYTVTGTSFGCTGSATVSLTVNPLPNLSVSASSVTLCEGTSATLTASGASSYIWAPNTNLSASTGSSVTASPSSSITYTVTGTDANACSNTATVSLTVHAPPNVIVSTSSASLCQGESATLTVSGANAYTWAPNTNLSATTGSSVTANPSSSTIYTVTGTDANGCTNTAVLSITINAPPNVIVSASSASLCDGQSATLTASGANSYTWTPNTSLSAPTGSLVTANPSSSTIYTVTGTDANGCTNTAAISLIVNYPPNVSVVASSPILCAGTSTSLIASGASTYAWSPGINLSATSGVTVTANPSSTTTYTVTGTDINGCTAFSTITLTVNPLPNVHISASTTAICKGDSANLFASGGSTYTWSPNFGLSATTGSSVSASPALSTNYVVNATDNNGCTGSATITLTVPPDVDIAVSASPPNVCGSGTSTITANGADFYQWNPPTYLSSTTGSVVVSTPATSIVYTVTGSNSIGCSSSASIQVNVFPVSSADFQADKFSLCEGQSVTFTNTTVQPPEIVYSEWSWTNGGGSSSSNPTITFNESGSYSVGLTVVNIHGCTSSVFKNNYINVFGNPIADFSYSPDKPDMIEPIVSFFDHSIGATAWLWDFGDYLSSENMSILQNPEHSFSAAGDYQVCLFVSNHANCIDTVCKQLTVGPFVGFWIPNTFTPGNVDGINDKWGVIGTGILDEDFELIVFNRWGEKIWEARNQRDFWDGKMMDNSSVVQMGVYVYMASFKTADNKHHTKIGHVNVLD